MKSFQQFLEDASNNRRISKDNIIPLGSVEQDNLNKAKRGQMGPRARGVTHTPFRLVPIKNP
jgi:hypothetical protein